MSESTIFQLQRAASSYILYFGLMPDSYYLDLVQMVHNSASLQEKLQRSVTVRKDEVGRQKVKNSDHEMFYLTLALHEAQDDEDDCGSVVRASNN